VELFIYSYLDWVRVAAVELNSVKEDTKIMCSALRGT